MKLNQKGALDIMFAVLLVSIVLVGGYIAYIIQDSDRLVRVEGFNYNVYKNGGCEAATPACGYCPGEVVNEECYIAKDSTFAN